MSKLSELTSQINLLQNYLQDYEEVNPSISQASIGWHMEHSLIVIEKMIYGLELSHPNEYKWRFNLGKIIAFTLNRFPRGKAKAPRISLPKSEPNIETIQLLIQNLDSKLENWNNLPEKSFILHPYFGPLKKDEVLKCLVIHTKHHLAIIRGIIKNRQVLTK